MWLADLLNEIVANVKMLLGILVIKYSFKR